MSRWPADQTASRRAAILAVLRTLADVTDGSGEASAREVAQACSLPTDEVRGLLHQMHIEGRVRYHRGKSRILWALARATV